ncbi:unnamed protein product, partial [Aureobasidium uvarum]
MSNPTDPMPTYWHNDSAYSRKPDIKQEIEGAARAQAPPGADGAWITSDHLNHGTVDYARGESKERRHIYP